MLELLSDPDNRARLGSLDAFALMPANVQPEGWLPGLVRNWAEVHAYLSRGHAPTAKDEVWELLEPTFAEASRSGEYALIAHSLGSIISGYLIGYGYIKPPSVFVTVGSQLGWPALLAFGWLAAFDLKGTWINIIDRDDPSAGFFTQDNTPADNGFGADNYSDLWVENTHPSNDHDFVGYMLTPEAIERVGAVL